MWGTYARNNMWICSLYFCLSMCGLRTESPNLSRICLMALCQATTGAPQYVWNFIASSILKPLMTHHRENHWQGSKQMTLRFTQLMTRWVTISPFILIYVYLLHDEKKVVRLSCWWWVIHCSLCCITYTQVMCLQQSCVSVGACHYV
jgi:hypothetical protein